MKSPIIRVYDSKYFKSKNQLPTDLMLEDFKLHPSYDATKNYFIGPLPGGKPGWYHVSEVTA